MRLRPFWIVPHDERTASVGGWPCGCAVVLLWVSLLALFPANAHALDSGDPPTHPKLSVEETVGFRETIKIGKWLPVTITVRNDGPALRGVLALELSTVSEGY